MTRQICLLLAALLLAGGYALRERVPDLPPGSVRFSRGDWIALGSLPPGMHEVAFAVENVGPTTVRLNKVVGSCTCAAVHARTGAIQTGDVLPVKVELTVVPNVRSEAMIFFHLESEAGLRSVRPVSITYSGGSHGSITFERPAVEAGSVLPGAEQSWPVSALYTPSEGGAVDVRAGGVWTVQPSYGWTIHGISRERTKEGHVFRATLVSAPLRPGEVRQGSLQLAVGSPPYATASIPVRLRARDDMGLEPDVISLHARPGMGERVADVTIRCRLPEGWMVDRVEADSWIKCMKTDDRVFHVGLAARSHRDLEVGAIRFHVVASASGEQATLTLRVVYDEVQ